MMSELLEEFPPAHLEYALRKHGFVGDWLVLGPLTVPLSTPVPSPFVDAKHSARLALRKQLLNAYDAGDEEIIQTPAERATSIVTVVESITSQGMWHVVNTPEDGRVDLAQRVTTPQATCAWTYAQVVLSQRLVTSMTLTTASPVHLWLNGELLFSFAELPDYPTNLTFNATLDEGSNEILVRVANVGQGDLPMVVALQIAGAEGRVTLPTILEPVTRRQKLATVMSHAYLAQSVYSREQRIVLRWPHDLGMIDALNARLQTPAGRIYGEGNPMVQKGSKVDFGEAEQYPDGAYEILLQPQFDEYYVQDMRVQRRIPLQIRNGKWSTVFYASHLERRQEALKDAAKRKQNLFAEIAKSVLNEWDALRHEVIEDALARVAQQEMGFEQELLALLGWVARMGDLPDFPQEVGWAIEESAPLILGNLDASSGVVLATCHLLAGQAFPQRSFANVQTGEWQQAHAEQWLLQWLRATAQRGLPAGESQQSYADALVALSHLVDLARADEVAEMAAVVLDKVAYQLALQCFLGVWGGSQNEARAEWLLNGRLVPLSGVTRLWWGQGAFNAECAATVALACAEGYLLPEIIAAVGLDRQQEGWLRRQDQFVDQSGEQRVNRAAYRTGDYLLASAQGDGKEGKADVLWQVTMGPDAVILGNRPVCSSTHGAWQPSYWLGNGVPVRVAQWHTVLAVGYGAGADLPLEFSHSYFPKAAFDEVQEVQGWVMARKGNGYVALTATGGVDLVSVGNHALREVRASAQSIWLVQMGRAATDGTFAQFVERVLAQPLALTVDALAYTSLRGEAIQFSVTKPLHEALVVDGVAQSLVDFPHVESIYGGTAVIPATNVEIRYHEHILRLDLETPEIPNAA